MNNMKSQPTSQDEEIPQSIKTSEQQPQQVSAFSTTSHPKAKQHQARRTSSNTQNSAGDKEKQAKFNMMLDDVQIRFLTIASALETGK